MTENQMRQYLRAEGLGPEEVEDRLDREADRRVREYWDEKIMNKEEETQ